MRDVVGSFVSLGMVHDVLPTQALDAQVVQEFPFDHVHWLCNSLFVMHVITPSASGRDPLPVRH